ncbi:methyl-accepting chemotaxis protein [Pseudomonas fluorescens]|uniref:Methyl-accepting chemotaxis protein n=2 Tax=Pseudomonas fluorescens TaxID=294 RepID=A0AAE2Q270_PSEFL|nr:MULTISPECIES: methyl-accepting chemotaxis protein [Pseudomonas fluorescens group]MBA1427243.1 methyl-accepting chemotaxis protein [Pseudomonas orientalis]MBD8150610.1 methyl-accepting chemotaxis protein [Pseudomonas fluorescens]MBD8179401.1 methyl-accepting chemotaxis protein [Pseudomonas fluorescens]MBD8272671.1 methyl-accepting chemotaxis protein [Pseudomonas fluorescens]MBD8746165.1 methyl-accepting chemotaxis protein [Pseudomonas fluorescens]
MNSWFGNISVNLKLGLGFGLVLVLTSILALTGWTSLGGLIDRSNWMSDITQLNASLTKLRIVRLQYMLANGDEAVAQNVQTSLDAFAAQQQKLLDSFKSPENLKLLNQQKAVITAYQQSLNKMREAYRNGNAARQVMGDKADIANAQIDALDTNVQQMPDSPERFAQYQAVTGAKEEFLLARYEVRGYTNNVNAENEARAAAQIEKAIAGLKGLNAVFGSSQQAALGSLETALGAYRSAVQSYKAANANIVTARAEMTTQGADIVTLSDKLYDIQLERRDAESAQARSLQLISTLLALLVGIIAALVITRQITRPLQDTLAVVERIASGDLSHTIQVTRRDELGVLQQGIQRMGTTLRELISGIRDGVTQIASAAEELSAVTEQTSAGVNSQKIETDQVATAMHEMTATVQEVARNAEQASLAAADADGQARAGDKVVAEAIAQIERLAAEVARSTDAMAHLQQESNKIGSVMDVIKAVAEQTNLLALNAAIEAARAGEAGRGFAVVADEVRGLAQRTQKSTEEIEGLVAGLQNGTQQVANVMNNSRSLTDSSVDLTRKAGVSLENITRTVSNIQSMNQQIAAAAEQQSAVAEEISRSIVNVRDVSEQTATASEETAKSSVELARLGSQLQQMVSHFRV